MGTVLHTIEITKISQWSLHKLSEISNNTITFYISSFLYIQIILNKEDWFISYVLVKYK